MMTLKTNETRTQLSKHTHSFFIRDMHKGMEVWNEYGSDPREISYVCKCMRIFGT